jgi:hypothetical protein
MQHMGTVEGDEVVEEWLVHSFTFIMPGLVPGIHPDTARWIAGTSPVGEGRHASVAMTVPLCIRDFKC